MATQRDAREDLWLFGYGSLIWRPDFEHVERVPARVEGWVRRFWQGSVDHRGVPGAPGRVATLLPAPGGQCVGMAFRVHGDVAAAVLERLDLREVGGYERIELTLHTCDGRMPIEGAITYVATADNAQFLGDAPLDQIAAQVRDAVGPSGPNVEYVLQLDAWLRAQGVDDPHVRELALLLRE